MDPPEPEATSERFDLRTWLHLLTMWPGVGAEFVRMAEFGLVHSDLNPTNWSITTDYKFQMIDPPGDGDVEYPKDWNLVAHAFLSLLVNLPDDFVAAFRFGCIQYGGKVAEMMFAKLRDDYQMHGFRNCEGLAYQSNQPFEYPAEDALLRSYQLWSQMREYLPLGSLCGSDPLKPTVIQEWERFLSERKLPRNRKADEYHFRKHLVASVHNGYFFGMLQSLACLQLLYHQRGDHLKAAGYHYYCKYLFDVLAYLFPDDDDLEMIERELSFGGNLVKRHCSGEMESQVALIPFYPYQYPNNPAQCFSVFLFLWRLDDLASGFLRQSN